MARPDDWHDAGLYDSSSPSAHERLALLNFLAEAGFSIDEMREAARRVGSTRSRATVNYAAVYLPDQSRM